MAPRDRVLAALRHEETDIVPYNIAIEPDVAERVTAHYGSDEWRSRIVQHFAGAGINWRKEDLDEDHYVDRWGTVWREGNIFHAEDVPLKEPSLKGYEFPDLCTEEQLRPADNLAADNPGKFTLFTMGLMMFERSWAMRGMENILVDLLEHESFCHELYDALMQAHLDVIAALVRRNAKLDAISFGDDFGQQRGLIMGVPLWRKYLKPRLATMYGAAHEQGWYVHIHTCGDVSDIIGDLIEIGVDILNPFQPEAMDTRRLKREYGERITFNGGISTQRALPFGTPDDVRHEVHECTELLGKGGGYLMEPNKPIMSDVPTENAVAAIETITQQDGRR